MQAHTSPTTGRRAPAVPRVGTGTLLAACAVLAATSLLLPSDLGYDPWAWLVWGREVTRGELSTAGGPSWKPLPVLVTTALAVFGDAAPELWLLVARAGGLFGMVLVYRLAARFAGPVAGVVAFSALLLTPDDESRWVRHLLQGNIEPLTAGLCLWAVQRHLDGRRDHALLFIGAAALLRPEAWPFLVLYAGWLWFRQPSQRRLIVPVLPAVPLLWFGGDWLASGAPLVGAGRARVLGGSDGQRLILAAEQIGNVVILPVWVAAIVCVAWAARRREPAPVVLAAAALAWMTVVAAMTTVFGYPALSRFLAPAAAILCVLAGIAAAWTVAVPRRAAVRLAAAAALFAITVPFAAPRALWLPMQLRQAAELGRLDDDLDRAIAEAGGRDALLGCGRLAIDTSLATIQARPGLAWKLDIALSRVQYTLGERPGVVVSVNAVDVTVDDGGNGEAAEADRPAAAPAAPLRTLARTAGWTVAALRCPRE